MKQLPPPPPPPELGSILPHLPSRGPGPRHGLFPRFLPREDLPEKACRRGAPCMTFLRPRRSCKAPSGEDHKWRQKGTHLHRAARGRAPAPQGCPPAGFPADIPEPSVTTKNVGGTRRYCGLKSLKNSHFQSSGVKVESKVAWLLSWGNKLHPDRVEFPKTKV